MFPHQESNLLPGFSVRSPEDIALNRSRNVGALMLNAIQPDHMAADLFAEEVFSPQPTIAQHRMLRAVAMSMRVNFIHAPGAGASQAGAMTALHRLMTHRNHRVLVVSPDRHMLSVAESLMRYSNHDILLSADPLFSVRVADGFWSDMSASWGMRWLTMADIPRHHVAHMIEPAHTIIVDNAHKYAPDFLRFLNVVAGETRQVIFIGIDANSALTEFQADPDAETVRVSVAQSPFVSPSFLNTKRKLYRDAPDIYEQIFQVAYDWEPKRCPA